MRKVNNNNTSTFDTTQNSSMSAPRNGQPSSASSSSSSSASASSGVVGGSLPSSQSMANLVMQLSSMNPKRGGGGVNRRKRKVSELDTAARQELEELREWRRRSEEKEKHLNSLFSASSSCVVCLYVRPDLISYGACGHMVCVSCTLEHVSRKLMVMRKRSQNTGCKARLSVFALNVEDSEFSCPICRKGQLDLMGAGLSLLPDFSYYQLIQFCAKQHATPTQPPQQTTNHSTGTNSSGGPGASNAVASGGSNGSGSNGAGSNGGLSNQSGETLAGLREERKALVLAQMERNRQAALKAAQMHANEAANCGGGGGGGGGSSVVSCPFCGLQAAAPGERGKDKLLPSEVLRHVWRCRKRSFHCGFSDCRKSFTWDSVYQKAPTSVGSAGDVSSEGKWLDLVNHAFSEHMLKECVHMTQCCVGWCEMHWAPPQIPLHQFNEHERRHKLIHDRFQQIGTIADAALRMERTLAALLRHEFKKSPTESPPPQNQNQTHSANQPPANQLPAKPLPKLTGDAANSAKPDGTVVAGGDVMAVAGPIAREVHSSLEALNDVLLFHSTQGDEKLARQWRGEDEHDFVRVDTRCPLHPGMGANENAHPPRPRPRPRTRAAAADDLLIDIMEEEGSVDENVFADDEDDNEILDQDYAPDAAASTDGSTDSSDDDDQPTSSSSSSPSRP